MSPDDEGPAPPESEEGGSHRPAAHPTTHPTAHLAGRARGRRRRSTRWTVLALSVVLVALGAWVGVRGWLTKGHLEAAATLVPQLEHQARAGGPRPTDLARLRAEADAARSLTADPVWSGATHLPWVGDDLSAVRAAARAVATVADRAVPPLLRVADGLDPTALRPRGGRIDLAPLRAAQAPLHDAVRALTQARAGLTAYVDDGPDAGSLVGPVERAVTRLADRIDEVADQTTTASRAADLLPGMLGADGERRYLVLFQNLAEARSLGGIAGAFAVVEADDGRLRIVHQGTAGSFPRFDQPVIDLSPGQWRLYQPQTARFFQNVTQPVSFPVGARIAREMWERVGHQEVDGVIATDPVALSYVLRASGPVTLPGGQQLTGENAVRLLLRDVYDRFDRPADQDAFFASAVVAVFSRLMKGAGDPAAMLDALARAAGERRLLVWSAHEAEQRRMTGTVLDGALPATVTSRATVGVFLNDETASKMSYYLRASGRLTGGRCRADGMRDLDLVLTMTSRAPPAGLPVYVTGRGRSSTVSTVVYLAAPVTGGVVSVLVDGRQRPVNTQQVAGRAVAALTVDLRPGQTAEVSATFVAPGTKDEPQLRMSPMVTTTPSTVAVSRCKTI